MIPIVNPTLNLNPTCYYHTNPYAVAFKDKMIGRINKNYTYLFKYILINEINCYFESLTTDSWNYIINTYSTQDDRENYIYRRIVDRYTDKSSYIHPLVIDNKIQYPYNFYNYSFNTAKASKYLVFYKDLFNINNFNSLYNSTSTYVLNSHMNSFQTVIHIMFIYACIFTDYISFTQDNNQINFVISSDYFKNKIIEINYIICCLKANDVFIYDGSESYKYKRNESLNYNIFITNSGTFRTTIYNNNTTYISNLIIRDIKAYDNSYFAHIFHDLIYKNNILTHSITLSSINNYCCELTPFLSSPHTTIPIPENSSFLNLNQMSNNSELNTSCNSNTVKSLSRYKNKEYHYMFSHNDRWILLCVVGENVENKYKLSVGYSIIVDQNNISGAKLAELSIIGKKIAYNRATSNKDVYLVKEMIDPEFFFKYMSLTLFAQAIESKIKRGVIKLKEIEYFNNKNKKNIE